MAPTYCVTPCKVYSWRIYPIVEDWRAMTPTYCVTPFIVYSQRNYTGINRKYNRYPYRRVECRIVDRERVR